MTLELVKIDHDIEHDTASMGFLYGRYGFQESKLFQYFSDTHWLGVL